MLLLVRPTRARTKLLPHAFVFMSVLWVGTALAVALERGLVAESPARAPAAERLIHSTSG
jgi:hypothetical protein